MPEKLEILANIGKYFIGFVQRKIFNEMFNEMFIGLTKFNEMFIGFVQRKIFNEM